MIHMLAGGTFCVKSTTSNAATLYIDIESVAGFGTDGKEFNADELATLRDNLISAIGADSKYTVNFQGVNIALEEGTITGNNTADYSDVEDYLTSGVETDTLKNTSVSVSGNKAVVQGSVGQVTTNQNNVKVDNNTLTLNGYATSQGGEVSTPVLTQKGTGETATVAGVNLQQGSTVNVQIAGDGVVGKITAANGTGTVIVGANSNLSVVTTSTSVSDVNAGKELTLANIGNNKNKVNSVQANGSLTAKNIFTENLTVNSLDTAELKATKVVATNATLAGTTNINQFNATNATFQGGTHTITDTLTVSGVFTVTDGADLNLASGSITAKNGLTIDGDAVINAQKLTVTNDVIVGSDVENGGAGTLSLDTLTFSGSGDLVVDPSFDEEFSFVGVNGFDDDQTNTDAGVLSGSAYVLQNAIVAVGQKDREAVEDLFARYINPATGGLYENGDAGAIFYVADNFTVADGKKIVIDPNKTLGENQVLTDEEKAAYTGDLNIRDNGVLAVDVSAATDGTNAAIKFNKSKATIDVQGDNAKIVLTGDYKSSDTIKLFSDNDLDAGENGLTYTDGSTNTNIRVETLNGLLYTTLNEEGMKSGSFDIADMELDTEKMASTYTDASSPVRNTLFAYLTKDTDYLNIGQQGHDEEVSRVHGAKADDYIYQDGKFYNDEGTELSAETVKELGLTYVKVPGATAAEDQYIAYFKADNAFLEEITLKSNSGVAAESAARMADFGGVTQIALKAGASTYDAISGRMGVGVANNAMTFANNGQGAGLWLTPIYVNSDSDGFEAQGVEYGADIDLYGVALGGDYTLANGVRVGAMFNLGSGEADGQGAGSAVTTDFDYYGFGLYAGYSVGQFSVVGDVTYTVVDNDVEANTAVDKLEASLDTSNLSFGITGAYEFAFNSVKVTPHAGLRYTYLDIDDYSVSGKESGSVGAYDSDSLSIFSIPVGVTIATEIDSGDWIVKPSFDVTLTGNFGDDETEGVFSWTNTNLDTHLTTEVFDNFTYGASLGIAAQHANGVSLGLSVGYTGSSNVDDLGVNANARFTF